MKTRLLFAATLAAVLGFVLGESSAQEVGECKTLPLIQLSQPINKQLPKAAAPAKGKFQLGRAKPKSQFDYGNFKGVVGQDGKTRYFPRLAKHLNSGKRVAKLPASVDYSVKAANVIKRMYLNDQYGDCVIASRYHQAGIMTGADTGTGLEGDDSEVYNTYQSACGRGDNGCDMSAVNQYQQKTGIKMKGVVHKTDGSVSCDNTNKDLVKAAIFAFGGLNVGFSLPESWYDSADGSDWGMTNTQIVGGHEVQAFGYDDTGVWIATWGGKRHWLWEAFLATTWIDEMYVTLSPDWYGKDNIAPSGIDLATLKADLALISGGTVPPLPGPNPPTPPTPPGPNPPAPGTTLTGSIITTQNYVNGVATGPPIVSIGGAQGSGIEAELKEAGVSPAAIIDILKLLADVKAKAGAAVILADLLKIASDFGVMAPNIEKDSRLVPKSTDPIFARREDPAHWALSA